jgi:hypothetical protein
MKYHMNVSIDGTLRRICAKSKSDHASVRTIFNVMDLEGLKKDLQEMRDKGILYIPIGSCNNQSADGNCLGHQSEEVI